MFDTESVRDSEAVLIGGIFAMSIPDNVTSSKSDASIDRLHECSQLHFSCRKLPSKPEAITALRVRS